MFFVASGGFDTPDAQVADQPGLLGKMSRCLDAFSRATMELDIALSVTTFTQPAFGRRLTSNGDGRIVRGNQLVIGGAVAGGTIDERHMLLQIDEPDHASGGRMIRAVRSDQYSATFAK
jgi:uncharacterized protein (DUF1501 family)